MTGGGGKVQRGLPIRGLPGAMLQHIAAGRLLQLVVPDNCQPACGTVHVNNGNIISGLWAAFPWLADDAKAQISGLLFSRTGQEPHMDGLTGWLAGCQPLPYAVPHRGTCLAQCERTTSLL